MHMLSLGLFQPEIALIGRTEIVVRHVTPGSVRSRMCVMHNENLRKTDYAHEQVVEHMYIR